MREAYTYAQTKGQGPLVFTFHGTGGDEHQFHGLAGELYPGASVISPRGDVSEYGAARYFRRTGEGVYDMDDLAARTARMADFMRAHIDVVAPSRVAAMGYSNGANILASVTFDDPALVDEVVLMHPLIPFSPPDAPSTARILMTAGRNDPICPAPQTERLDAYFRAQGADIRTVWHEGGHELRQTELVALQDFIREGALT
ncbi:phospholipase/carboxylesterase [Litoreibacter ponti]|uniref:Phospholipase/carboxylesterase n=1 Tax=Litoreibacter ponti TaxID=1510457 RepID=A0A2T6BE41_9RHOB|nr:alpha/beta hydrolase [Litoreibacter ponti]PTX54333.1 phospholipase/carboxylesterase [Litoreibacter ponti]